MIDMVKRAAFRIVVKALELEIAVSSIESIDSYRSLIILFRPC